MYIMYIMVRWAAELSFQGQTGGLWQPRPVFEHPDCWMATCNGVFPCAMTAFTLAAALMSGVSNWKRQCSVVTWPRAWSKWPTSSTVPPLSTWPIRSKETQIGTNYITNLQRNAVPQYLILRSETQTNNKPIIYIYTYIHNCNKPQVS